VSEVRKNTTREDGRAAAQERRGAAPAEQGLARSAAEASGEAASLSGLEQDGHHQGDTRQHVKHGYEGDHEAGHSVLLGHGAD
jgi:hypothetical protein